MPAGEAWEGDKGVNKCVSYGWHRRRRRRRAAVGSGWHRLLEGVSWREVTSIFTQIGGLIGGHGGLPVQAGDGEAQQRREQCRAELWRQFHAGLASVPRGDNLFVSPRLLAFYHFPLPGLSPSVLRLSLPPPGLFSVPLGICGALLGLYLLVSPSFSLPPSISRPRSVFSPL